MPIPSANSSPSDADVKEFLVPLVVANLALFSLFSLLSVQTFIYYYAFTSRDRLPVKLLVLCVFTLLLTQVIFAGYNHISNLILAKNTMGLGWFFVPVLGGIVGLLVQNFYAWRIYVLSRRLSVALLISCLSMASTAASFVSASFGAHASEVNDLSSGLTRNTQMMNRYAAVCYSCSAVCDVVIAICMTILGGKIMDRNMRYVVNKLVVLTIETNALTSVIAVLSIILLFGFPGTTYFATTTLLLPVIYGNTLMTTLLSRICLVPVQDRRDESLSKVSFAQIDLTRDGERVPGRDAPVVAILSLTDENNFEKAVSPGAIGHSAV
ncbi:hypothetical protein PQX77_009981 [Marasmius sp. AFHP31]|nr:hypothetical protein PQX77_009981 [Marasmius sp. AFHP31]